MTLRRGFALARGRAGRGGRGRDHDRRLDARGDRRRARPAAPASLAVGSLVDRSAGRVDLGLPRESLLALEVPTWTRRRPARCAPQGSKPEKPGSRARRAPQCPSIRLTLAYDGTDFLRLAAPGRGGGPHGAGRARSGRSRGSPAGRGVAVAGAGRTDAGVHALGQVASFELPRPLAARRAAAGAQRAAAARTCACSRRWPRRGGFHARRSARLEAVPLRARLRRRAAAAAAALRGVDPPHAARRGGRARGGRLSSSAAATSPRSPRPAARSRPPCATVTRSEVALRRAQGSSTRSRPTASCARWCAAWWAG